ncbi:CRB_1a_G0054740.mRNA.1.CDS.1 [Saccharomyces cerevisiae]|nr:CRB_1a_G0054740.mRNA.1.CDS.1 [Saccharomyces cerevisiae]CAI7479853.1 CRB_1a_G0054740.mRNA.1.CDS.1 [Saccharomyces cerevisiae]
MTQSLGIEQYKLSVVSGGKPALNNLSSVTGNKNIARLSHKTNETILYPLTIRSRCILWKLDNVLRLKKFANNSLVIRNISARRRES